MSYWMCSKGHVYAENAVAASAKSIHLLDRHAQRCPVCGKMRITSRVDEQNLTPEQKASADGAPPSP